MRKIARRNEKLTTGDGARRAAKLKTVAAIVGASAVGFIMLGGISQGYSIESVIILGAMGTFFGAVSVPELEPNIFRYPTIWQICCSVASSLLLAFVLQPGVEGYLLAATIGVYVGFSTSVWIKHIVLP